ncbi:hypothetical protein STEG23_036594, partial [Scotinomys teguina]
MLNLQSRHLLTQGRQKRRQSEARLNKQFYKLLYGGLGKPPENSDSVLFMDSNGFIERGIHSARYAMVVVILKLTGSKPPGARRPRDADPVSS